MDSSDRELKPYAELRSAQIVNEDLSMSNLVHANLASSKFEGSKRS
jgi:uncharacterized protein YjbI with pentapeptide repeats